MKLATLVISLVLCVGTSAALGQNSLEYQYGGNGTSQGGQQRRGFGHAFGGPPSGTIGGSGGGASLSLWEARLREEKQREKVLSERWAHLGQGSRTESPQEFLENYNRKKLVSAAENHTTSPSDPALKTSIMFWPWIRTKPSDWDRLRYAESIARWAEAVQPLSKYNPDKDEGLTITERKLLDGLAALRDIKDTEGSEMAEKQSEEVKSPIITIIFDSAKDKAIETVIGEMIAESPARLYSTTSIIISLTKPMVIADDTILMRDALKKQLETQLDNYQRKRDLVKPPYRSSWLQLLINSDHGEDYLGPTIHGLD
jgi:hypothetical protein